MIARCNNRNHIEEGKMAAERNDSAAVRALLGPKKA